MKNKSYLRESFECYIFLTLIMIFFFGVIVISGIITGNEWWEAIDFSWDVNTWSDLNNINRNQ
jgi:hypothetical protein